MNINTRNMSFVKFNNQEMEWVKFNNVIVYESWKTLTSQGIPPLTLLNCKGGNLLDYKIYGNSVQNGTPTPSNPVEIQSVGERTKNLINVPAFNQSFNDAYYVDYFVTPTFLLEPNTTYTLSFDYIFNSVAKVPSVGIGYGTSSYNVDIVGTSAYPNLTRGRKTVVFTTPSSFDSRYTPNLAIRFARFGSPSSVNMDISNVQLEQNPSASAYEPYGYEIPVTITGKNLINVKDSPLNNSNYNPSDTVSIDYNKVYWMAASGYIRTNMPDDITVSGDVISFTTTGAWYGIGYPIKVKPNTKYTISGIREEGVNTKFEYAFYDNTGVFKSFAQITTNTSILDMSLTVTTPADVDTIFIIVAGTVNDSLVKMSKIQIEEGQNRTPYELYHAPIKTNIYLDKPLMGLGDYADYLDFENQKVYRKIKKAVIDNNSTFGKFSAVTDYSAFYMVQNDLIDYYSDIAINQPMLSPQLVYYPARGGNTNTSWTGVYQISTSITSTYKRIIFSLPNTITDVASAKAWLQSNPIDYYYSAQTPTEESITLPDIPSIKGTTIYTVDTNVQPSNMYVKYKGK